MLIRIVNDPRAGNRTAEDGTPLKNTELIDKIISVKGLPTSVYLRPNGQWVSMRPGVEIDVPENMPFDIMEKHSEPFEVDVVYPPMEKGEKAWSEKVMVHAIRIDTQTNDGNRALADLERTIDAYTPRTEKVVKPEVVGDRLNWTMSLDDVPFVDLGQKEVTVPSVEKPRIASPRKPATEPPTKEGYCEACNKTFMTKKALTMHKMRAHPKMEEVVHG